MTEAGSLILDTAVLVERDPMPGSYSAYAAAVSRELEWRRARHELMGATWTNPRIEARFAFSHAEVNPVYWPTRMILHWAPETGWSLQNQAGVILHRLQVGAYASPEAVATAAVELLQTGTAGYGIREDWEGAAGLEHAIAAWHALDATRPAPEAS